MAIAAILQNRRMFPQEGSAPLGVAAIAILIDGALDQLFGIGRAVWIVATGAGNLALSEGHMGGTLQLGAAHLVASQAEVGLAGFCGFDVRKGRVEAGSGGEAFFLRGHDFVAIHAGQTARLVGTASPEHTLPSFVALQAHGVLFRYRNPRLPAERDDCVDISSALHMRAAGAMTGFTAPFLGRRFRVFQESPAHGRRSPALGEVLMAGPASLTSDILGILLCLAARRRRTRSLTFAGAERPNDGQTNKQRDTRLSSAGTDAPAHLMIDPPTLAGVSPAGDWGFSV